MADSNDKNPNPQLSIELPEDVADGTYANLAIISHSSSEFVLDFVRLVPNVPKVKVKSRVIVSPQNAKRLMRALGDNIAKFENQFGTIQEHDQPTIPPMAFKAPKAEA